MEVKHACIGGRIEATEFKEIERDGIHLGVVEGYLASFKEEDVAYPDKFEPGAFLDTIEEHKQRNNRPIRLNFQHDRNPIGGFPIESVKEDTRGLFGVGEINLDRQLGREVYSLARQGVLSDFSVGFSPIEWKMDGELRIITKARLYEASLVDEPMNKDAQVTAVKADEPAYTVENVKEWTPRDLEAALLSTGRFTRSSAKYLVTHFKEAITGPGPEGTVLSDLLGEINAARQEIGRG